MSAAGTARLSTKASSHRVDDMDEQQLRLRAPRFYWRQKFQLTEKQVRRLSAELLDQLENCKSDEARRILIKSRMEGHEHRRSNKTDAR